MSLRNLNISYDDKDEFVDIKSHDFHICYAKGQIIQIMQCQYEQGTEAYDKIKYELDEIAYRIRNIAKIVEFKD